MDLDRFLYPCPNSRCDHTGQCFQNMGDNHQHTKAFIYAFVEPVDPNPIIGWTCWCGVSEDYDDDQIPGLLP
jgi:hypothetical protein